jgi:hypothetical protein
MANPEHLEILRKGEKVWNEWREKNPRIKPQLGGVDLNGFRFSNYDIDRLPSELIHCFNHAEKFQNNFSAMQVCQRR